MDWEISAVAEYVACAMMAMAVIGIAWLVVVELSRDMAPAITEEDRSDLAIW